MTDREKVICAIENCIGQPKCKDCPWEDCEVEHEVVNSVPYGLLRDAISLLKEQEAVKPIWEQDSMVCGVCGHDVIWQKMLGDGIWGDEELNYCPYCGRKVKWDEID